MSKKKYLKLDKTTAKDLKKLILLTDGNISKQGKLDTIAGLIEDALFDIEMKPNAREENLTMLKIKHRQEREMELKAFAKAQYPDDLLIDHLSLQELTPYLMSKSIISGSEIEKLCKMANEFYNELGKHIDLKSYLKDVMGEKEDENEDDNPHEAELMETV